MRINDFIATFRHCLVFCLFLRKEMNKQAKAIRFIIIAVVFIIYHLTLSFDSSAYPARETFSHDAIKFLPLLWC